ncbi:MAG TPA: hypothetical protein DCF68_14680 [Cyanothece sp. UBA12306]|nr:hypothetical protein [Cyanothece sp. UBA12306]
MKLAKKAVKSLLQKAGYQIQPLEYHKPIADKQINQPKDPLEFDFSQRALSIYQKHWEQTVQTVEELKKKYEKPVLGEIQIWQAIELLGRCIDPTDTTLYCLSQLTHSLQVVEGMEQDGITDPELLIAALVHDLGKILLLTDEAPENVVCVNTPIGNNQEGIGLDNCVFQWNHDEYIYARLKDYLPDHIAWLLRYHSIRIAQSEPFMDNRDKDYTERYLIPFRKYDIGTKSVYNLPQKNLGDYHQLLEQFFPKAIVF